MEPGPVLRQPMLPACVQSTGYLATETELGSGDVHVMHRSASDACQQVRAIGSCATYLGGGTTPLKWIFIWDVPFGLFSPTNTWMEDSDSLGCGLPRLYGIVYSLILSHYLYVFSRFFLLSASSDLTL